MGGPAPGDVGEGGPQGRSGGDPVVGDHHGSPVDRRHGTEHLLATPHLGDGCGDDPLTGGVVDLEALDQPGVEQRDAIRGDGSDCQLRVLRSTHLYRGEHSEITADRGGDLGGDHHSAPGDAEHQRVSPDEVLEQAGEDQPGLPAVAIPGHGISVPATRSPPAGTLATVRRLLLVANPAASGFTAMLHRSVVGILRPRFDVTPIWPDGPWEAEAAAAAAADDGVDVIAAMGGDGIVHRVANGIAGTGASLAVIPAGTSNVFARLTGYPRRGVAAAEVIAASRTVRMLPTARIDAVGPNGPIGRIAIFATGVGYDADVILESERRPLRKVGAGTLHYGRSALRVAIGTYRRRRPDLTVTVDGSTQRAVTAIAQVHDRFTFLGRRALTLSPEGGPAAIVVRRATPLRLVRVVVAAVRHRDPGTVPGVRVWHPFSSLTVTADGVVGFEADGEYFGEVTSLTLAIAPGSLRLLAPRAS